jgi:phosphatidylglycerophosphate synthase
MTPITESDSKYSLSPPEQLFPLTRHFSYRLTPLLLRLPVTPNQVTAASLLVGVVGAACFLFGLWGWDIFGALLIVLSYTLDCCDGEIARIKSMISATGEKFDDIADSIVDSVFFILLGIGTTLATGSNFWMWLGFAAAAGAIINFGINTYKQTNNSTDSQSDKQTTKSSGPKKPEKILDWIIFIFHKLSRAEFCNIILVLAVFNVTWVLLPLAAVGAQVYWITGLLPRVHIWHAKH